jgi:hypothetical protein
MNIVTWPNLKHSWGLFEAEPEPNFGFVYREHPKEEYFIEVEDEYGLFNRREGE